MNNARIYAVLAVVGLVLPLSQFLPWAIAHGLDVVRFVNELFVNAISRFFAFDVIVSAVVTIVLVLTDDRPLGVAKRTLPIVGTLCVGVSFGLPLYLYLRVRADARAAGSI
jgi:hypothetical protein